MAVHRRPLVDGPPVELLTFRGDDWISDNGVPPLERWHKARFEWALIQPSINLPGQLIRSHSTQQRGDQDLDHIGSSSSAGIVADERVESLSRSPSMNCWMITKLRRGKDLQLLEA
jgi:hypothetical protein